MSTTPIDVKKLLENPALELFEELTAARLKHAGVTLGEDLAVLRRFEGKSEGKTLICGGVTPAGLHYREVAA